MQFLFAVLQSTFVRRIDDPDESVGGLEVVPPVRAKTLLAADVPHVEVEAAMLQGLDVEAQRGADGADVFAVELLQNRRFARIIQPAEIYKMLLFISNV